MPINAHPDYLAAEKEHQQAQTLEEKLKTLEKMISVAPGHKGAENLRKQLTTRRKKLLSQIEKIKKSGKSSKTGIKKEDMQAVIVGLTNTGKSSLLKLLTNAQPKISEQRFTSNFPIIGMMNYATTSIQLVEIPAIHSENYDKGVVHTADTILLLINKIEEIKEILPILEKTLGNKILVFNKIDLFSDNEKRKLEATLKSKYKNYDFCLISVKTEQGIEDLKSLIFQSFGKIRVYTKEPHKEKSPKPIILKPGSTVKDFAKIVHKNFVDQFKFAKVWGPSSKFGGMICGLKHELKDKDIVELHTR